MSERLDYYGCSLVPQTLDGQYRARNDCSIPPQRFQFPEIVVQQNDAVRIQEAQCGRNLLVHIHRGMAAIEEYEIELVSAASQVRHRWRGHELHQVAAPQSADQIGRRASALHPVPGPLWA